MLYLCICYLIKEIKGMDKEHDYVHGKYETMATVIVSILIIHVSIRLIVPGLEELMEKSLPEKDEKKILVIIMSFPRIGNYCAVGLHVCMDKGMTFGDDHDITEGIAMRNR